MQDWPSYHSYKIIDDKASSSGILALRRNAKLKSKDVRFLFSQVSSTYINKLKFGYSFTFKLKFG